MSKIKTSTVKAPRAARKSKAVPVVAVEVETAVDTMLNEGAPIVAGANLTSDTALETLLAEIASEPVIVIPPVVVEDVQQTATVPAVTVKMGAQAVALACAARVNHAHYNAHNANQAHTLNVEYKYFSGPAFLAALSVLVPLGFDPLKFASSLSHTDAAVKGGAVHRDNFVAVYALQKVRKMCVALATGLRSQIDGYTHPILLNLSELQTLDTKTCYRVLSPGIELNEFEQQVAIRRIKHCDPTTASTQASSTREMLRHMGVCNVVKGARGDSISFKPNPLAQRVLSMYIPTA